MHRLSYITIKNYRSCKQVALTIDDFTPIVGYNNAGKSNILNAIEWFLEPSPLTASDFNDPMQPIILSGVINGITEAILKKMPENHQKAITPYWHAGGVILRRTMAKPGAASTAKLEVRNPSIKEETADEAWTLNPAGIPQALKALFPESIRIRAMEDASDDVGKASKTNTIGKLIAEIIEPVRKDHEMDIRRALDEIAGTLSADGKNRASKLTDFDKGASDSLKDLFPGLQIKLDVPLPEIPDLFKNGTVRVFETHGASTSARPFESVGHGAQRCIQMALIRYLAERKNAANEDRRTLLLIDEPELYLHPQGVEQVRLALQALASKKYQVIFSTHAPAMLHRDQARHTVIVRKPDTAKGTSVRKPLSVAVTEAINEAPHQSRLLFELGRASEVFFSDLVLLSEGKTEGRLLPAIYERAFGRTARADRVGLVALQSCGDIAPAMNVLKCMEIGGKAVADLDYAFVNGDKTDNEIIAAKVTLNKIQPIHGFTLDTSTGFPKNDHESGWTAADAWACFASDAGGAKIVAIHREKLLKLGIWIWSEGTIEDVLGVSKKGEEAIQAMEQQLQSMSAEDVQKQFPSVVAMFNWLKN